MYGGRMTYTNVGAAITDAIRGPYPAEGQIAAEWMTSDGMQHAHVYADTDAPNYGVPAGWHARLVPGRPMENTALMVHVWRRAR